MVGVHEDTWTVTGTMNGLVRTTRLTERDAARLREAESVVIVKRAA